MRAMRVRALRVFWLFLALAGGLASAWLIASAPESTEVARPAQPFASTEHWIPLPAVSSDLANPATRQVLQTVFNWEQVSQVQSPNLVDPRYSLPLRCGTWSRKDRENDVYRMWIGDPVGRDNPRAWFIKFEPAGNTIHIDRVRDVSQPNRGMIEDFFGRVTSPGVPPHAQLPAGSDAKTDNISSFELPIDSLDDIRSLWGNSKAWNQAQELSDVSGCEDGMLYLVDACIGGRYAARNFQCSSDYVGAQSMWDLIQKHFTK